MNALDTNVLIYACDKRDERKQEIAYGLIASGQPTVLLWQVACEFVNASRKLAPVGFSAEDAWNRLTQFARIFPLVSPIESSLGRARQLHLNSGLSFWDSMVIGSALEAGVTTLYSEDLPGKAIGNIEIVNPFA